jgi:hypothetical protein
VADATTHDCATSTYNDVAGLAQGARRGLPLQASAPASAWRKTLDEGNAFFATAKDATTLSAARKAAVKMALVKYNAALPLAAEAHQRASTNKNMFLACGLVTTDDDAEPEDRYYFLSEALRYAENAIASAVIGGLQAEWVGTMIDKVSNLVAKSVVEAAHIASSRFGGVLQLLASVAHGPSTQPHVRIIVALALLDRTNKKAALAIADGDFKRGAEIMAERVALVNSVVELGMEPQCAVFKDAISGMKDSLRNTSSLAVIKKQLQKGKQLREESVADEIDMDKVFEALDAFRTGVIECHYRKLHLDIEAELLSEIGYIWSHILKVREAAHSAYHASVMCALSCFPHEFTGHVWFKRAMDAVEAHHKKKSLEAQSEKNAVDEPILKELEPEFAALKAHNTSIDAILKYVTKTYPGKKVFVAYNAKNHGADENKYYRSLLTKVMVKFQDGRTTNSPRREQLLFQQITLVLTEYINAEKVCNSPTLDS